MIVFERKANGKSKPSNLCFRVRNSSHLHLFSPENRGSWDGYRPFTLQMPSPRRCCGANLTTQKKTWAGWWTLKQMGKWVYASIVGRPVIVDTWSPETGVLEKTPILSRWIESPKHLEFVQNQESYDKSHSKRWFTYHTYHLGSQDWNKKSHLNEHWRRHEILIARLNFSDCA